MPNGGKRPGAGRPKGSVAKHTLQAQEMRKRLIAAAEKEWDAIIDSLLSNAIAGNNMALAELLDRVLGKASTPIELDSKTGLPFTIVINQKPSGEARS
jgi:hypothetical protein